MEKSLNGRFVDYLSQIRNDLQDAAQKRNSENAISTKCLNVSSKNFLHLFTIFWH